MGVKKVYLLEDTGNSPGKIYFACEKQRTANQIAAHFEHIAVRPVSLVAEGGGVVPRMVELLAERGVE